MTTAPHDEAVDEVGITKSGGHVSVHPEEKTVVFEVAELLVRFGSPDVPLIIAVFVICAPGAAWTFTTRVIEAELPFAIGPIAQVTVPVPPTGGVLQLPGLDIETNVVPVGITSVKVTPVSVLGPLFVTVII